MSLIGIGLKILHNDLPTFVVQWSHANHQMRQPNFVFQIVVIDVGEQKFEHIFGWYKRPALVREVKTRITHGLHWTIGATRETHHITLMLSTSDDKISRL